MTETPTENVRHCGWHLKVEQLASPSVHGVSVPITVPVKRNHFGRLYDVPMFPGFLRSEWQDLNLQPPVPNEVRFRYLAAIASARQCWSELRKALDVHGL